MFTIYGLIAVLLGQSGSGLGPADDRSYLIWGLVLLATAVVLIVVEMFVPASGTLALLGSISLVSGLVLLMWKGGAVGQVAAVVALASSPFVIMALLRFWPHTPVARMFTLHNTHERDTEEEAPPGQNPGAAIGGSAATVGAKGTAMTDLRPIGTCVIEGQRIECLADGPMIRAGSTVRVVAVDGIQTKVREE